MSRGAGRRAASAAWAAWALAIVPTLPVAAEAEEVVVIGAGPVHLRKRTPRVLEDTTAMGRIEAGYRVHPRGVARVRVEGLTAEGINLFCDLVAELELGRMYGLQGFAGVSYSDQSGAGSHTGVGGFVRHDLNRAVALRLDAFAAGVIRTDFSGVGVGLVGGVEWRPRR